MPSQKITIGEQIQILRQRQQLTQAQLAKQLHTCQVVISRIENGLRQLSHAEIIAFSNALGVEPLILLNTAPKNDTCPRKICNKNA